MFFVRSFLEVPVEVSNWQRWNFGRIVNIATGTFLPMPRRLGEPVGAADPLRTGQTAAEPVMDDAPNGIRFGAGMALFLRRPWFPRNRRSRLGGLSNYYRREAA